MILPEGWIVVTPWFDPSVKPVRSGMYERLSPNGVEWSWFDADIGFWRVGMMCSCQSCMEYSSYDCSLYQNEFRWRGMLK